MTFNPVDVVVEPIRLWRFPLPILTDITKQAVFYFVPLRRTGREMADMNINAYLCRQLSQAEFPQFVFVPVAAAAIAGYQQFGYSGKGMLADTVPPPCNTFHREIRRVVAYSDVNKSGIVVLTKYFIQRYFSQLFYRKIMVKHVPRVFASAVFPVQCRPGYFVDNKRSSVSICLRQRCRILSPLHLVQCVVHVVLQYFQLLPFHAVDPCFH
jgi:hypothetical protein